jgi:uncharacterized DUF497 family protein
MVTFGFSGLDFEFDPNKSASNKLKHGIDFEEGKVIWADPQRAEVKSTGSTEARSMITGLVGDKMYTAIITYRGKVIRIISIRRARDNESARHLSRSGK